MDDLTLGHAPLIAALKREASDGKDVRHLAKNTVEDWEKWTKMPFPSTGTYTIPDGLTTLTIDRDGNIVERD